MRDRRCDRRTSPPLEDAQTLSITVLPKPEIQSTAKAADVAKVELPPGVRLLSDGLVLRLQNVVDHFHADRVTIVSGYRPNSAGSFHQLAQALDIPVGFFFDDQDPVRAPAMRQKRFVTEADSADSIGSEETRALVGAYYAIDEPENRRRMVQLAKALAKRP